MAATVLSIYSFDFFLNAGCDGSDRVLNGDALLRVDGAVGWLGKWLPWQRDRGVTKASSNHTHLIWTGAGWEKEKRP